MAVAVAPGGADALRRVWGAKRSRYRNSASRFSTYGADKLIDWRMGGWKYYFVFIKLVAKSTFLVIQ